MLRKGVIAGSGLIALLCLCGVAAALLLVMQIRGAPLNILRSYMLQQSTRGQPCPATARLVPGSYHPDPVQAIDGWILVTYTADCAWPGQPPLSNR